jgi:multiple sugar transport system permease protein
MTFRSTRTASALKYVLLTGAAFLILSPLLFMIIGSLKPDEAVLSEAGTIKAFVPDSVSLQNYRDVIRRVPFGRYLFNSIWINGLIVLLGLMVNSTAGYALARLGWSARKRVLAMVIALMVIPFEAIAVPLFFQLSALGLRDTYLVQIAPFIANPLSIYLFYSFFLGLPKELEEAARVDGAGVWRTFFSIIVPNAKPVFAAVAIVTFLFSWGSYMWPLLMTSSEAVRPLPLGMATFFSLPPRAWGDILAFGVMLVLPVIAVFALFQRHFVRGIASTGIKG